MQLTNVTYRKKHRKSDKNKETENVFQIKEQDKTTEKDLNKMEMSDLFEKELKTMFIMVMVHRSRENSA